MISRDAIVISHTAPLPRIDINSRLKPSDISEAEMMADISTAAERRIEGDRIWQLVRLAAGEEVK